MVLAFAGDSTITRLRPPPVEPPASAFGARLAGAFVDLAGAFVDLDFVVAFVAIIPDRQAAEAHTPLARM